MKKFFGGGSGGGGGSSQYGGSAPFTPASASTGTEQRSHVGPTSSIGHQSVYSVASSHQTNNVASGSLAPPGPPYYTSSINSSRSYTGTPSNPNTPSPGQATSSRGQYFDSVPSFTNLSPTPSNSNSTGTSNGTMHVLGVGHLAPVQNLAPSSSRPTSPTAPSTKLHAQEADNKAGQSHAIDRNDMHKSLKALESVLVAVDEYRDLKARLAKSEKRLAKSLNELGKAKALEEVPANTLLASSAIFEGINDVHSKHAKMVQKEYEALNEHCARYFKKIAKEEKAHDDLVETLDSKVKKAHATHEKNVKKSGRGAVESHDKYIRDIQGLTNDIASAKSTHGTSVGAKTYLTSLAVAATMGGLADAEWKAHCEEVRKIGPHVGKLNEWLNFASSEAMANVQPPELTDEALGWAQVLAVKELEAREAINQQEKLRQAAIEKAQTAWKAEQMGWQPPQHQQQQQPAKETDKDTSVTYANLPRLDSNGKVVSDKAPGEKAAAAESPKEKKGDAANVAAVAVSRKPTVQAMSVKSEKWEEQPPSPKEDTSAEEEKKPSHHAQSSSGAEGTIIDRGQDEDRKDEEPAAEPTTTSASPPAAPATSVARDTTSNARQDTSRGQNSSDATPSLSNSASNLGSEDSNNSGINLTGVGAGRGPHTPLTPPDERLDGLFDPSKMIKEEDEEVEEEAQQQQQQEQQQQQQQQQQQATSSPTVGILKNKNQLSSSPTKNFETERAAAVKDLPLHRPLDRYVDTDAQRQEAANAQTSGQEQASLLAPLQEPSRPYATASLGRGFPTESTNNGSARSGSHGGRSVSVWEREKEREKQLERETELQRRLAEAEDRLRMLDREGAAVAKGYRREDVVATPPPMPQRIDYVASPRPRYSEPVQQPRHYADRRPDYEEEQRVRYEPDRYAPSVGGSRLSNMSLNRTLSTDSERSFVARMKAHYQAEKEERDRQRGPNVDRPLSPPTDLPSNMRRVTDLASSYQTRFDYSTSGGSVKRTADGYGGYIYDATPSSSAAASRQRHDSAPLGRDEYESYSAARHARPVPPNPPPRHPVALQHQQQQQAQGLSVQPRPPVNYRRLSAPPVNPAATATAPPRKGAGGLTGGGGDVYPRRSFEDGRSAVSSDRRDEEQRRVAFAQKPQLIR